MKFYGRQDIVSLLNKRADGLAGGYRQNIAIMAEELMGKTYLVQHWVSHYQNNLIVPVYIDVNIQEASTFRAKFVGRLLFSFLKNSQIALKEDIDFLISHSQKYIPKTVSRIKELLSGKKYRKFSAAFVRLLELTELFYEETGKRCIIILDEFHLIDELKAKDTYEQWRKHIMFGKNTMYILLSSKKSLAAKILSSDLTLLFGNFETVELHPFDNKTAQSFIRDELGVLQADSALLDFIINFTAGNPFYLKTIATAFKDHHSKNAALVPTVNSLAASLENMFMDTWGILNRRFVSLLETIGKRLLEPAFVHALIGLASGINRPSQIAQAIGKAKKDALSVLNHLCSCEVVVKTADIYCVRDKVFCFWLRCIYAHKFRSFSASYEAQKASFGAELKSLFTKFYDAQAKDTSERILELFNQFSNESIEIHHKRLRLNHFKEVKLVKMHGKKLKEGILARASSSLWITGFKEEKALEEDMVDFVNVCKRFKYNKNQKKIFIAFDGIDANAHLLAKEERIATWDMALVNSLLDMYDKPRIVMP